MDLPCDTKTRRHHYVGEFSKPWDDVQDNPFAFETIAIFRTRTVGQTRECTESESRQSTQIKRAAHGLATLCPKYLKPEIDATVRSDFGVRSNAHASGKHRA